MVTVRINGQSLTMAPALFASLRLSTSLYPPGPAADFSQGSNAQKCWGLCVCVSGQKQRERERETGRERERERERERGDQELKSGAEGLSGSSVTWNGPQQMLVPALLLSVEIQGYLGSKEMTSQS
jgi:hypothetical protein